MIEFSLNGETVQTDDAADTPLLWVVRDSFHLKGSKYGCGAGLCGACTMHVDGRATRSCLLPISAVAGKSVVTIEGLGASVQAAAGASESIESRPLHPLQIAWVAENVPQCGYCQSGQIMNAAAFLQQNPQPTEAQVVEAMSGNLCRCGCYPRIKQAIMKVAANQTAVNESVNLSPSTSSTAFSSPSASKASSS